MDFIKKFSLFVGKCGFPTVKFVDEIEYDRDSNTYSVLDFEEANKFQNDPIVIKLIGNKKYQKNNNDDEQYYTFQTYKIPNSLENCNYFITINGYKVQFSCFNETMMSKDGTFFICTCPGYIYERGIIYQTALEYCYKDIKEIIKTLNQIIEIDEKNGVRFGKDERWINNVNEDSKFEFHNETNIMYIK